MEKRNTRVAVPLSDEAYDAVSFLAKVGGVSRGKFLAETLEAAIPSFLAIQAAYKAALAVEGEERAQLVAGMKEAERRLMESLVEVLPASAGSSRSSDAGSPAGGERVSGDRADPPVTNRGVPNASHEGQGD